MKYPGGWNKLGNLQKGLTNKLQFSALLWQMRPSEEVGSPGLKTPLSVCIMSITSTLLCLRGGDW